MDSKVCCARSSAARDKWLEKILCTRRTIFFCLVRQEGLILDAWPQGKIYIIDQRTWFLQVYITSIPSPGSSDMWQYPTVSSQFIKDLCCRLADEDSADGVCHYAGWALCQNYIPVFYEDNSPKDQGRMKSLYEWASSKRSCFKLILHNASHRSSAQNRCSKPNCMLRKMQFESAAKTSFMCKNPLLHVSFVQEEGKSSG